MSPVNKALLVALPLGMLLGVAGTVLAADPRLDDANSHIDQAIALLTAADNPARERAEFGGHRKKAIDHLNLAKREVGKAKAFADKTAPKDGGAPPPKTDGGTKPAPKPTADPKPKPKY